MEKSILFNTDMVKAILEGRKTQTRRIIKPQPLMDADIGRYMFGGTFCIKDDNFVLGEDLGGIDCTYSDYIPAKYQVGDILWVKETWREYCFADEDGYTHFDQPTYYLAANGIPDIRLVDGNGFELDDQRIKWKPSIHMPRKAARIFLKVTNVKVEQLQDITEEDVRNEGCRIGKTILGDKLISDLRTMNKTLLFIPLWDSICAAPSPVKKYGKITHYKSYPWEDIQETRTHKGLPWFVCGNPSGVGS